jgi:hypothetical protein
MGAVGLAALVLLAASGASLARDLPAVNPPYPRIGNCYGAGLGWQPWEKGREYWSKLDLFIGGGYDLHYDWEHERWPDVLAAIEANVARVREVNPHALVLPYVDVVEGPDNPHLPAAWWDLRNGERWSGWPGYFRVDTTLPEVLQYNLDKVREEILGRECFDGVFYDCWGPDAWLVPRTAESRDGQAIVMVNEWNLPRAGFAHLNGCLAEDELNRVVEGKVDFEEFLGRYLRWCTESRRPVTTMLVCHPRKMNMDPWHWSEVPWQERQAVVERLRDSDPRMLRFGLATTLLGDGYFGYDCANLGRGQWWWFPEYDAPLGYPQGPAERGDDGLWRRAFDGGLVVVNGTPYDAVVDLPRNYQDFSTGRVAGRFTLRMYDGLLLVPTDAAASPGEADLPRLTAGPPTELRAVRMDEDTVVVQTPTGLELRFASSGELRSILSGGRTLMAGGWPAAAAQPFRTFEADEVSEPVVVTSPTEAGLIFAGALVQGEQRVQYSEVCTVQPQGRFTLRFAFTAQSDLNLRLWRHYFMFPVQTYAGAEVSDGTRSVILPTEPTKDPLLSGSKRCLITKDGQTIEVQADLPLSLIDHRQWGTPDYLLAGYPVGGKVASGATWSVEIRVQVSR